MPTKFADIAKGPNDLLSDDFTTKISLKCKKNAGPIAVTIETERGSGGALSSKVGTKFSYAGVSFDKLQLKADGGHVLESSLCPAPGGKVSFKGNKGADLLVDYSTGTFFGTSSFDVKDMSKFSASACAGVGSGVTVGADAAYSMSGKSGSLSAYNLGASYASGPLFASLTSASKISQYNVGILYKVNDTVSVASVTSHSASKPLGSFSVGGAYKAKFGDVKAKIGNDGNISASLVKEVAPKVNLTVSGTMSGLDSSTFKYGVGIVM